MLTLSLDTATRTLSVALVSDQLVLAEASEVAAQSHAERLPILLAQLLSQIGKHSTDINLVAVGVGPGAYTGLRVGLMFATAFARATNAELVGICTHDAIAPDQYSGLVITDARRKEVYLSRYLNGARISSPTVVKPDQIDTTEAAIIGDGVAAFPALFPTGKNISISAGRLGKLANAAVAAGEKPAEIVPKLSASAESGADAIPAGIGLLLPPFPLYLRRPDVAEPK
jgi:tRNA threonylcarbamoyl adenosine modification protein YeaZ